MQPVQPLKYGYRSAYGPLNNRRVHSLAPLSNSTPHIVPLAAAAQLPLATSVSMSTLATLKPVATGKKKPLPAAGEPSLKSVASLSALPSAVQPLPPTPKPAAPMMAVDHSLEMFRTGVGAGAGAGRVNAKDGYRFDGDVAEAGKDGFRANDNSPVTDDELEHAHRTIRQKIKTRFKTFRDGFRLIDEDGNGKVNKVEALRMLMIFNLTTVREKALVKLVDLMDINGDGIDYNEFTKWLMSESVHDMPSHHLQR